MCTSACIVPVFILFQQGLKAPKVSTEINIHMEGHTCNSCHYSYHNLLSGSLFAGLWSVLDGRVSLLGSGGVQVYIMLQSRQLFKWI